jgi:hypothetical protein
MNLEKYPARYTWQLEDWNTRVFEKRNINYEIVNGDYLDNSNKIVTGSVLDAHGRSYYSLTQHANLVKKLQSGEITSHDVIFYEDMFTPGIECLPYILDQTPQEYRPKVFVRCLAQTVDPDDFVNREGMFDWMRPYETMIDNMVDGIIVASEEMVANLHIAGFKSPVYVSGLPFGKHEVQGRVDIKPTTEKTPRVVFAARWDDEKQPHFYMDVIEQFASEHGTEVEFAVLSGHDHLKSNRQEYVDRALSLQDRSDVNFKVYTGLSKDQYYQLLNDSRVLFNCALQDWVSNTVSEADALGVATIFPAYRSFPEVFANSENNMYIPWSVPDAVNKIYAALFHFSVEHNIGKVSDYQDKTIDRTLDILSGVCLDKYSRNQLDYRKFLTVNKW